MLICYLCLQDDGLAVRKRAGFIDCFQAFYRSVLSGNDLPASDIL
uniref:Uncharacterized protein n=1 Tax=Setaria italica TaxID=4555 RepID=K3YFJ2_SETIT